MEKLEAKLKAVDWAVRDVLVGTCLLYTSDAADEICAV